METQHYILKVQDPVNGYGTIVQRWHDATSTANAIEHFRALPELQTYFGNYRYQIIMVVNPVILQYPK